MNDSENGQKERTTVTKTISLPDELLDKALARAELQNRTLSNYVRNLIYKDLRISPETGKQAA